MFLINDYLLDKLIVASSLISYNIFMNIFCVNFCFSCRHALGFVLFVGLTVANVTHVPQLADFITMFTA